jgi:hypothetical protein
MQKDILNIKMSEIDELKKQLSELNDKIDIQSKVIHQQNLELENVRRTLREHEHTIKIAKVRSVECLSLFSKIKERHLYSNPAAKRLKLNELLAEVNKYRPTGVRELDRTELLECSRPLGLVWRKSDSDMVTDGWSIREKTNQKVNLSQNNNGGLPNIQSPTMSPLVSPIASGATSSAPIMMTGR